MSSANKKELLKILLVHILFFAIGTYFVGYKFYLLYWLFPYFTVFQMITWFIELAEHYPVIAYAKSNIEISRNRFSHFIEHFFYWNARRKLPPYSSFISCYSILELRKSSSYFNAR